MGRKDDLKRMFKGPLSEKAKLIFASGQTKEISGYASLQSFDRGIDNRYLAKSQRIVFHALREECLDAKAGDTLVLQEVGRRIVAIQDNLDETVSIELKEEILERIGEDNGSGSNDSSRFG